MTEKKEIKIYIAMNEDGNFDVGLSANEAGERLDGETTSYLIRTVELTVLMALPRAEEGPTVDIPDAAGSTADVEVTAE
jgi:hypothetical protein